MGSLTWARSSLMSYILITFPLIHSTDNKIILILDDSIINPFIYFSISKLLLFCYVYLKIVYNLKILTFHSLIIGHFLLIFNFSYFKFSSYILYFYIFMFNVFLYINYYIFHIYLYNTLSIDYIYRIVF